MLVIVHSFGQHCGGIGLPYEAAFPFFGQGKGARIVPSKDRACIEIAIKAAGFRRASHIIS